MPYTVNELARMMEKENVDIEIIHAIESLASSSDITAIGFQIIFDTTYPLFSEYFNYTDGILTQKNYYTDSGLGTKIWQVDYSYDVDDNIQYKDIQLILTGITLRITYIWVLGELKQKDRSWL